MENWLVEKVLLAAPRFPALPLQGLLELYVRFSHLLETATLRETPPPPGTFFNLDTPILSKTEQLMAVHYNQPLELFTNFLGRTMKYSAALWQGEVRTLDEAQACMMDDVCTKAGIRDGQKILDIGCGFGALCTHILQRFEHCEVTGLNVSRMQNDTIKSLKAQPSHPLASDRFRLLEANFAELRLGETFDRVVSLGFFEHVTRIDLALGIIRRHLTPDGRCFLHYITCRRQPTAGIPGAARSEDFMEKYVFPGGHIHAFGLLMLLQRELEVTQAWFLDGNHYRRTLDAWLHNFLARRDEILATAGLTEKQLRLWEIYLRACRVLFAVGGGKVYGNGQYLLKAA